MKNDLRPHLNDYWCIPPEEDAEFVANMEDILDVYQKPYDPKYPLWCMDEKPYQILGEAREPLPMRPGDLAKVDSEYVRNGTVSIFCFIQPHTGKLLHSVEPTRTAVDWAEKIKYLVDEVEPDAEKIILVMDNLNTHNISSLYKAFPPEEANAMNADNLNLVREISQHSGFITAHVQQLIDARRVANRIEDQRERAIAYHDTVAPLLESIRYHVDKLELIIDDELWPLPKYRELLFIR
jgi:hypothetical protein